MSKKRLLFISNLFPNPAQPNMASFNRQQVAALSRHFDIVVVAPISWQVAWRKRSFSKISTQGEVTVYHPTFWYPPGFGRRFYGQLFYRSIRSMVLGLHRENAFDFVFGAWLYPDGWAAAMLSEELEVPFYLKVHGTDVNRLQRGNRLTTLAMQAIGRARSVFCVSRALSEKLVSFGCDPAKLKVVYNGVNKEIFSPMSRGNARGKLDIAHDKCLVLYVGNLKKAKGLGELALAFGGLKNAAGSGSMDLILVGNGPFRSELANILQREGCADSARFLGSLSLKDVALWMNAADVLCLPSYMEGTPNVILEALSCNTPVVATSVGGIPELACLDDRVALAEPHDSQGIHLALESALCGTAFGDKRIVIKTWHENAVALASIMLEG